MTTAESFRVGEWRIEPSTCCINRGGTARKLEPKVMDLLVYLASRPGEVIPREELEDHVWAGMVVGYDALTQAIIKLRKAVEDDPKHPRFIETIPKKGYRLNVEIPVSPAAVTAESMVKPGGDQAVEANPVAEARSWRRWLVFGAIASVLVVGALAWQSFQPETPAGPVPTADKPSVAVLPFTNMSDDPSQEYFSDGITEDIITNLSRFSNLLVISRTSTIGYKGVGADIKDIGKQLGARYIIEGSVRKSGNQVRITAQLIDASSDYHMWAGQYDRELDDIFALQEEVTKKIVEALSVELTENEQLLFARPQKEKFKAYEHYLRGRAFYGSISKEGNDAARMMYENAIAADPTFARAYAGLAMTYVDDYRRQWGELGENAVDKAFELANRAIEIDAALPQAHWVLGYLYMYGKTQYDMALESAQRAIALDPNFGDAYALVGSIYFFTGNSSKAFEYDKMAMRLNPGSSFIYWMHLGRNYYMEDQLDEALAALSEAVERNSESVNAHVYLAAAYARAGQPDEAAWEVDQILTLDPEFTIEKWRHTRYFEKRPTLERLIEDLRKAGMQ